MADETAAEEFQSSAAATAGCVLAGLALPVWVFVLAVLSDLGGSDAAGNAMAGAYAGIAVILLWVLLAIALLIAFLAGETPRWAGVVALILAPASAAASFVAVELLAHPQEPPHLWPLVAPAAAPPLILFFCLWALLPPLRSALPGRFVPLLAWAAVGLAAIAIIPMQTERERAQARAMAAEHDYDIRFAGLAADAPLWALTPFLQTRNAVSIDRVLARMRSRDKRQEEAELMLARGDFPLGYLGRIDLEPTPSLCEKARALLRQQVKPLAPNEPDREPYSKVAAPVGDALAAMRWLVGYGCSCDAEAFAWQSMARMYRDTNFDVVELGELREPKELGRLLREAPARFSMLTAQAHLKAWLSFADDAGTRDRALAGARKLEHRTNDAVEMLADDNTAANALVYLPELDLTATPALCAAAGKALHARFARIYHPKPDDPRPYADLMARIGAGDLFADVIWLGAHGCNANVTIGEAEALAGSYQDSPERAALLARLAALHRP
jgi:hypothetical protein